MMNNKAKFTIITILILTPMTTIYASSNRKSLIPRLMEQPGIVEAHFLFEKAPFRSSHASTIVETKDNFISAYFAGTDEGNKDVGIWISIKPKNSSAWAEPVEIANGIQFSQIPTNEQMRHPCWNPVLYYAENGQLLLFYKVGPTPSSWWGMLIVSNDQGKTWSEPQRLPEGILGPVRAKPVKLPDGTLLCGSSTEDKGWRVHMEITPDLGKTWSRTEALNNGKDFPAIQPTILTYPDGNLQILCRSRGSLRQSWSTDGGKTWSPLVLSILPNPSAGIDAVTLKDGRQLLVYNHSTRGRDQLNVAVSTDGKNWKAALKLEDSVTVDEKRAYGAYPAAILASDGLVHITYTWRREKINHVVIDPSRLKLKNILDGKWPG
ncbi:MAG: sialidase family protein [Sedimentisphaerales bacterium]|nr:sialidase family protein [Sedimentisphaerales bacterium]